jgi:hypothetical protein
VQNAFRRYLEHELAEELILYWYITRLISERKRDDVRKREMMSERCDVRGMMSEREMVSERCERAREKNSSSPGTLQD